MPKLKIGANLTTDIEEIKRVFNSNTEKINTKLEVDLDNTAKVEEEKQITLTDIEFTYNYAENNTDLPKLISATKGKITYNFEGSKLETVIDDTHTYTVKDKIIVEDIPKIKIHKHNSGSISMEVGGGGRRRSRRRSRRKQGSRSRKSRRSRRSRRRTRRR